MNLDKKVVFLNNLVDKTLTITHYTEWEIASYGQHSLFCGGGLIGYVRAKDFVECVNMAFELAGGDNEK